MGGFLLSWEISEDEDEEEGENDMEEDEIEADDGFVNHLLEQLSMMRVKVRQSTAFL